MFVGTKWDLEKWEAKQIRQGRPLETYWYDINRKIIWSNPNIKMPTFTSYKENVPAGILIDQAFKYAKEGTDSGKQPKLP